VVGFIATAWAAGILGVHGYRNFVPSGEEANIAIHLANGHGYRSPMDPSPTAPPSAWSAPVYPLIIATAYSLFGVESPQAIILLLLLNTLFVGAIASGLHRLAGLVFRSETPAILAAVLLAFHPLFVQYMGNLWDGVLSLAMFLWLTVAAFERGIAAESGLPISRWTAVVMGVAMGLLALTNPSYVATLPVLVLIAFPARLSSRRWGLAVLTLTTCLLVISPWTIRNYASFRRLVVVRTAVGVNLWLGNLPGSAGWFNQQAYTLEPYVNVEERRLILRLGEPAYDALAMQRFRRELAQSPSDFFTRCLRRAAGLLLGEPTQPRQWLVLNSAVAALGVAGMVAAWRRGYRQRGLPALAVCVSLPFIPTMVIDRYRLPLLCLLLLYSAGLLCMLTPRRDSSRPAGSS
jgi:hypothetical protein